MHTTASSLRGYAVLRRRFVKTAPTIIVTKGRPPTEEGIEVAIGGEIKEEYIEEIKEEEKILAGKGTELNEAKDANDEADDKAIDDYY
ncbi:uncharacterized protein DFL_005386 [Arthrobotrys flagrans]|uniref:Uncharacterized protein n=1 Tax=Arthrobotrys flagrans TaxID=97331 RepID=A0A437A7H7_ARTFL|nr:hypothetical protein DFL_005386 [Arthrobotrys flagrans]